MEAYGGLWTVCSKVQDSTVGVQGMSESRKGGLDLNHISFHSN